MSPDAQLRQASLVFIGVIQGHHYESWPSFRFTHPAGDMWRVLRREVIVETILRGTEYRKKIDLYEISWSGATSGDWNTTNDGGRYLFLVQLEGGLYHVVGDPSDDMVGMTYHDPGGVLSLWREIKLERGLVRHPSSKVRMAACFALLELNGLGQDECWDALSNSEREQLRSYGLSCCTPDEVATRRLNLVYMNAPQWWNRHPYLDERRVSTAVNSHRLRTKLCELWELEYPDDHDNGCPADWPPPATIVTEQGDVPLPDR
jgi:hypothetical protein